jgi:long-chain acyl-CoA synthetase
MQQKPTFRTLNELLSTARAKFADRTYLAAKKNGGPYQTTSVAEFGKQVDEARAGLAALGVKKGDRVAIISDNCVEWPVVAFAVYGLGAWVVPMYESQAPEEWAFIIADCQASVVAAGSPAVAARFEPHRAALPSVKAVVALRGEPRATGGAAVDTLEALRARGAAATVPPAEVRGEDMAALIYTSGTTGKPKGVMLTHDNLTSNMRSLLDSFTFEVTGERSLAFIPWAHVYGQVCELYMGLATGSALYLAEAPTTLVQNLAEAKPTILYSVPRVWNRVYAGINGKMLAAGGLKLKLFRRALAVADAREKLAGQGRRSGWLDLQGKVLDRLVFSKVRAALGGQLKYALSGAAALSPEVARFFSHVGLTVCEGYGLTETSPVATNNRPGAIRLGSVGKAIPGCTIKVVPVEGAAAGEGELVIYGPNVMKGYYNRPEETAAVMLPDGGFRTGDVGRVDADGYVYITGRVKEQFKLENGKYVAPAPLEEQLKLSPYLAQVFLHGANKPHLVALVVPNPDALKTWVADKPALADKSLAELCQSEAVQALVRGELDRLSAGFKGFERIQAFTLVPEDFTLENGLVTPSLKVKRTAVVQRYGKQLDALYQQGAGSSSVAAA